MARNTLDEGYLYMLNIDRNLEIFDLRDPSEDIADMFTVEEEEMLARALEGQTGIDGLLELEDDFVGCTRQPIKYSYVFNAERKKVA